MDKRWIRKPIPPQDVVDALSKSINVNPYLSTMLTQRGITTFDEAKLFFRPLIEHLHEPFLMTDMAAAVDRLDKAIKAGENILVYGDYDVDGTTSVALVYSYLTSFYPNCKFYIPDRSKEGYGVSRDGILWAEQNGFSLIIALDLGIKSSDMVMLADHKGIDFIICDHHLPGEEIPQAVAVLDPKREDCNYPFTELSGCGIGYKLLQAYARKHRDEKELEKFIDLVAVSIASDIVPVNGENRILAYYGLKKLNENPLPGLKALIALSGNKSEIDIASVVFTLGPRINAAGRVSHAHAAVELLISKTEEEAMMLAEKIDLKNDLRREFDLSITEEAIAMIEANENFASAKSTVLFKENWHKGVIGIVAARCVEKYYRPTIILTESNDKITGSARSVRDFDLHQAIASCSELLEKFGGHKYAAGLTMSKENLIAFQSKFEEVVSSTITDEMLIPVVEVDLELPFDAITPKFRSILKQIAPFGPENHKPVFESGRVFVMNSLSTFKDKHIRFLAGQRGCDSIMNVVGFDMMEHYERLSSGGECRIAYTIEENTFNGMTSLQLRLKDLKFD
ncbi:MAG: single-stranded-DNA-specific exonuclease RecJ [Cyclobacteriaceae bacterium]|nr:single-stranded-DNA-specific exonuclease RecJ [Cyclobacteriaceae bacterium]